MAPRAHAHPRAKRVGFQAFLATAVILAGVLTSASAANAGVTGYLRLAWSPNIYEVQDDGSRTLLTYEQWRAVGSPAPRTVETQFVKTSWSSTVYAVVTWPGPSATDNDTQQIILGWGDYIAAGRPRVSTVTSVAGTTYFRWASDSREIYAETPDGYRHRLAYEEWRSAGAPAPTVREGGYFRAPWSDVIHEVRPGGGIRQLAYAEWIRLGMPTPGVTPVRYVSPPWSPIVYGYITWPDRPDDRAVDQVASLSWAEYILAGRPAIATETHILGEAFLKYPQQETVFHAVQGYVAPLTYADWTAAGSPIPQSVSAPSPAYIKGILIVNKSFPLPSWYGNGLTAETTGAFAAMRAEAASRGLSLAVSSGFRSYTTQQALYSRFVSSEGIAGADRHSARAGHSEHQTGLAIDLNSVSASFANTKEGMWVRDNAHRFGFIVRYPPGREHITGYIYEPWHLRFVGVDAATHIYTRGLSLEEYLGVSSRY